MDHNPQELRDACKALSDQVYEAWLETPEDSHGRDDVDIFIRDAIESLDRARVLLEKHLDLMTELKL